MEDQADVIKQQMQDKRAELATSLETLERKVTDNIATAGESVTDTMKTVSDNVQETVDSVKQALDLSSHVRDYPWLAVGGGVVVGYLAHEMLTQPQAFTPQQGSTSGTGPGMLSGPLSSLGQFAVRTALALAGKAVKEMMPEDVGSTLSQLVEQMNASMDAKSSPERKDNPNGKAHANGSN